MSNFADTAYAFMLGADIMYDGCCSMDRDPALQDLWKERNPPKPLRLEEILPSNGSAAQVSNGDAGHVAAATNGSIAASGESACKALGLTDAHRVWDISENAQVCSLLCRDAHRQSTASIGFCAMPEA